MSLLIVYSLCIFYDLEKYKNIKIFFFLSITNYQNSYILDISAERLKFFLNRKIRQEKYFKVKK